ncbi:hypothetical protein AUJ67_00180 [Candidatus Desantisbacteria bacterium CG1_02_49_89]|nr:MAG: hypothetical protein AUJ67_00180 [Candidatus Desantisbacteria bacterium CG1_02_49_89]
MKLTKLSNIFDIKYGNGFELYNLKSYQKRIINTIPFVARTAENNGISAFVEIINNVVPFPSGLITVSVGGSVLEAFLQPERFYTGFHVLVLFPKYEMEIVEKLYYCYCIRKNKYKYSYGRQANKTLKDILIPKSIPQDFVIINCEKLNTLIPQSIINQKFELNTNDWQLFELKSLFTIKGSKTTPLLELEDYGIGKYPYVTTRATNNGVEGFYNYYTEEGNVLTVDSAVLGYCSYQPLPFSASDHVEKLIPKFKINKYIALFLTTIINLEQYRYNYGIKCSQIRMRKLKIKLPVKNGKPNWEFMERYIKSLPYSISI